MEWIHPSRPSGEPRPRPRPHRKPKAKPNRSRPSPRPRPVTYVRAWPSSVNSSPFQSSGTCTWFEATLVGLDLQRKRLELDRLRSVSSSRSAHLSSGQGWLFSIAATRIFKLLSSYIFGPIRRRVFTVPSSVCAQTLRKPCQQLLQR